MKVNSSHPVAITKSSKGDTFFIVAIGASAGGLEAITALLKHLPPDTGMSFIYIQHLSPDHKSILSALLSKVTKMQVQEVTNKILMEPDNVYVIPPDKEMTVTNGHIRLTPRHRNRVFNLPIDSFFSTLADKHKEAAIGIILSGNASDGTAGIAAIKHGGGITFAQDNTAKNKSMPDSAIATGVVDFVLSPKDIAAELVRISQSDLLKRNTLTAGKEDEIDNTNPDLKDMLKLLHKETGVDFSHYKMNTIKRRIMRKMLQYKIPTLKAYTRLMTEKNEEIEILYKDLLIHVTDFFRDNTTHQYFKTTLFPTLLLKKQEGETLRLWIPACSTGEEAYSIAMILLEVKAELKLDTVVQIFATDLSLQAISKARVGQYAEAQLESVSPERLSNFYTKTGSNYRIAKAVRDMCVFSQHNLLIDPPFSKVDFISCCNLLIYFDTAAQKKVISTFYYALLEGGYLTLGKSETIGSSIHLFDAISKDYKIYQRRRNSGIRKLPELLPRLHNPVAKKGMKEPDKKMIVAGMNNITVNKLGTAIDNVMLRHYVPGCVVINYHLDILEFRGNTDIYLSHSSGKASLNILKIARPEIALILRSSIQKAITKKEEIKNLGVEVEVGGETRVVSIHVIPTEVEETEPLLLIVFNEQIKADGDTIKKGKPNSNPVKDQRIKKLEEELAEAHSDMTTFAHNQDLFNEELQSVHEEVVSSNEELQSVNEELETSKEEIESANEELITTNQELQTRNELLVEAYDYAEAITETIHEPMIILDKDLFVKSANKAFYVKFNVREEETVGVLFYDLGHKQWNIPRLRQLLEGIIPQNDSFQDYEVKHTFPAIGKKVMLLNASRIVQKNHNDRLILLAFDDITERSQLNIKEKDLLKKVSLARKVLNTKLEKAVKERTKQLEEANDNLGDKNSELEKMNKELEAFAYISSHDLQEPLRKIQTFSLRILEKEEKNLSEQGKVHFKRMRAAAAQMRLLIDNLLTYSRTTTTEKNFELFDLKFIITDVLTELAELIEEKNAVITVGALCEFPIIPFQISQLIHNLLTNSIKFSRDSIPPRIKINAVIIKGSKVKNLNLLATKKYCHLQVQDNGIGFENAFSTRIFEVFQKLHTKDQFAGTGIGLAIVKKIVDNHNGIITATSELNMGATFDIYIPIHKITESVPG
ncbi:MAG: chemotaxis protein CheB [Chitinophagaceae bacterium]|jgi:two-component system CheB/CheR fusion protein